MIETEINPHVEQWEKEQIFPAKEVFKAFGQAGLLGINKPVEYGGLGLDYKYQLAFLESTGHIRSAGTHPSNILSLSYSSILVILLKYVQLKILANARYDKI